MDSLSQLALGAAVGVAVMGRRTAVWKAALWGAVAGTLPDLDVFIDRGGPVNNMVLHRGETHALFWLTLFSLPFSAAIARLAGEWPRWRRWWLAMWLVLVTHPLLDTMTVYGTQLALPFSNYPYGVGSIFIIDPLYTVPLLVGTIWALVSRGKPHGFTANAWGLAISTLYLAWGVAAQHYVNRIATEALQTQGISAERLLVTPTPFNSVLWRVLAVDGDAYYEGFYSLLDPAATDRASRIAFDRYARRSALAAELAELQSVERLTAFSKGFYALRQQGDKVLISDLRMGQEPSYSFTFVIAEKRGTAAASPVAERQLEGRGDIACTLSWLRRRITGELLPAPARFCRGP